MAKMIQIRNVPDEMHRQLKARAARQGKPLSDFLKEIAAQELAKPDLQDFLERVRRIPPDKSGFDATAYIRKLRDSR